MQSVSSNAVYNALQAQRTSYGLKIGNLMIEDVFITVGTLTFDGNGRVSISNPYQFNAPFTTTPTVVLNSQNSADYGYCAVIGIVRTKTGIDTIGLMRNNSGTYGNIYLRGIAIGI